MIRPALSVQRQRIMQPAHDARMAISKNRYEDHNPCNKSVRLNCGHVFRLASLEIRYTMYRSMPHS